MYVTETRYRFPLKTVLAIVLFAFALATDFTIAQESNGAVGQESVNALIEKRLALLEQRVATARELEKMDEVDRATINRLEMDLLKAKLDHTTSTVEKHSLLKKLVQRYDSMIEIAKLQVDEPIGRQAPKSSQAMSRLPPLELMRLQADQLNWKIKLAQLSEPNGNPKMKAHFLEIVTPEADATCQQYAKIHHVEFSEPVAQLGNARTVQLADGITLAVRQPMHDQEEPVTRVYTLVPDIKAALKHAEQAGGEIAVPPMEIPDHGTIAIYFLGGIQHGLWQK